MPLSRELRECLEELDTHLKPAAGVMAAWLKQHPFADRADQAAVLDALGRLGEHARAQAELIRLIVDGEHWTARRRVAAALAIFRICGDKDKAFAALRDVFSGVEARESIYYWPDFSDTARVHAVRALGVLSANGDERARAILRDAAKGDENPHVQDPPSRHSPVRRKPTQVPCR